MPNPIHISVVVEDYLCEAVIRRILYDSPNEFMIAACYISGGYNWIKNKAQGFNNAAKGFPYCILVDLTVECAPAQLQEWLSGPVHPNLLFRIAVKECESWILADRQGFASFLGISVSKIPTRVDDIDDPKRFLISLAMKCRKRELREAIVPAHNSLAKVGPRYNECLGYFVQYKWAINNAVRNSPSLYRAVEAVNSFQPHLASA